ncbi:MAG: class I SAM-dependent methyltransferase [Alphaproteobacteria bacterium]
MIRFLSKVAAQRLLGVLPGGETAYIWAQYNLTRSFALTGQRLANHEIRSRWILDILRNAAPDTEIAAFSPHLDIGAGWLPMIPLVLRQRGLRGQWLVDLRKQIRPKPAIAAARCLDARRGSLPPLDPPDQATWPAFAQWFDALDIHDIAPAVPPYDLPGGGFGLVTCWGVLQYPSTEAVQQIHAEAVRLLRPGGLYIANLRLDDQYAIADPALPRFHFLRFSHRNWNRWFDNAFTPMNRLRPSDHARLLEGLPFERLLWQVEGGGPAEQAELARCPPHRDFAAYAPEDLSATRLTFVLRRTG